MLCLIAAYAYLCGWKAFSAHYFMPWLSAHNWYEGLSQFESLWTSVHNAVCRLVMITYLQHSDPTIPYYRKVGLVPAHAPLASSLTPIPQDQWTFVRGALATVDRPIFGWAGRFFLHNISSDHVAHHFFSGIPFCTWNQYLGVLA